jgi:nucleotide-binding universal stress UspA family protein
MFKNILLPLDGSHFSELAFPLAIRVARAAKAKLHIVRVHVPPLSTPDAPAVWDLDESIREQERSHLAAAVGRAQASDVEALCDLLEGPITRGLERYVSALGIDLVAMTTHGRSGLKRAVLGSVAEHCVRTTHVPLLLLHPRTADDQVPIQPESVKRILIALDGSPESETSIRPAVDLALLTGARLTLAMVATAPFDIAATIGTEAVHEYLERARRDALNYLQKVAARLSGTAHVNTIAVSADRAAQGILRCRDEVDADLIAMATHGRGGWSRIAVGSVAESVLHKSPVPVLILRPAPNLKTTAFPTASDSDNSREQNVGR